MNIFGNEITRFVNRIESLQGVYPSFIGRVERFHSTAKKNLNDAIEKYGQNVQKTDDGKMSYEIEFEYIGMFEELIRRSEQFAIASLILPQSLIISLISQFDVYIGRLIRCMYTAKPQLLNGCNRTIPLSELLEVDSLDSIRSQVIEKEIDSVLRDSHIEQITWFEKQLSIPSLKKFQSWGKFVELTERRNLYVHCDGIVSNQYLQVCASNEVKFEMPPNVGEVLPVTYEYSVAAYKCIYEVGVKLGQITWRKLIPDEWDDAGENINNICLMLLQAGKYDLALLLLDFATQEPIKHQTLRMTQILTVNLAQAHKWLGRENECRAILDSIDWSIQRNDFLLCEAVLRDDFEKAAHLMRVMGVPKDAGDGVPEHAYRDWPIFKEFRKSKDFFEAYHDVFGSTFLLEEDSTGEKILEHST